jgi:hypothetical protein
MNKLNIEKLVKKDYLAIILLVLLVLDHIYHRYNRKTDIKYKYFY